MRKKQGVDFPHRYDYGVQFGLEDLPTNQWRTRGSDQFWAGYLVGQLQRHLKAERDFKVTFKKKHSEEE